MSCPKESLRTITNLCLFYLGSNVDKIYFCLLTLLCFLKIQFAVRQNEAEPVMGAHWNDSSHTTESQFRVFILAGWNYTQLFGNEV